EEPLPDAFRPLIGPIFNGSNGSTSPVQQAVREGPLCAHSGRSYRAAIRQQRLDIRVTSDLARDLTPWPSLRRDGVFARKVVVRPQHEGDAATVDEFGGQSLDRALRGVRLHPAAPQALHAAALDFLL